MLTLSQRSSMYYNKPQRNMDEADKLRGLDEERAVPRGLFMKFADFYADIFYKVIYQRRPNSAFPRMFSANPFCRMFAVEGIPGSGAGDFASRLSKEKNLMFRDTPSLYYFWERYGRADCKMRQALSKSFKEGGPGNYWEEQYNMDWSKVYANVDDWRELCKALSWQIRGSRLAESDNVVEHLIGFQGLVKNGSYFGVRALIHACGETGRIPTDMYQSFIDQWNHMEGRVEPYPVMCYIDASPEEAYANIQNSDQYTADEKAWYTLDFLKAYQDGMNKFVLPQAENLDTLIFKMKPDEITNIADVCESMVYKEPGMVHYNNMWHMENNFLKTCSYSTLYNDILFHHMDLGGNQNNGTYSGWGEPSQQGPHYLTPYVNIIENQKAFKIIKWRYPREGIDGFGWGWDDMNTYRHGYDGHDNIRAHDKRFLAEHCGGGYIEGQNDYDKQKYGLPTWFAVLFQSDHRKMLGQSDGNPFRRRYLFGHQSA